MLLLLESMTLYQISNISHDAKKNVTEAIDSRAQLEKIGLEVSKLEQ